MSGDRLGTVHWIDHAVVATNDLNRWIDWATETIGVVGIGPIGGFQGTTPGPQTSVMGLTTSERKHGVPLATFQWFADGSCHIGAFLQPEQLPPSKGLGKDLPRYGFFVRPEDVDEHLLRLERLGVPHSEPFKTEAEGDEGTGIYFEDPDGNQFEFWAPANMPAGAMDVATELGVGRISSAVYGARDLQRTATFFDQYCDLERLDNASVPEDTLVLPLAGGARLVYNLTDSVDERVAGHGPWFAQHIALTVQEDQFLPNYHRMWDALYEDDGADVQQGEVHVMSLEEQEALPARTALHGSPVGRRWKETYKRGDEFYDWDCHGMHFVGGISKSTDGSLATYVSKEQIEYLKELTGAPA